MVGRTKLRQWCQDRAIYIAVMDSIEVIDKKSQRSTGEIPDLLKEALYLYRLTLTLVTISLKTQMIDSNSTTLKKKNFHLTWNTSTRLPKVVFQTRTLNICLAGTGVGKSLFMCHMASSHLDDEQERTLHYT